MKAIITVGLGFGDEGKGATVDALTRELNADLVVRYCGGAQAGHNVELPDGRRHTFSQFGAGTMAGANTYLGSRVVLHPATLVREARNLRELGIDHPMQQLTVHPDCLIATSYHVMMNRLRELARGEERHGSCGLGIGETRSYWLKHGLDAVVARDLLDYARLVSKLTLLRDRFQLEMQQLTQLEPTWAQVLTNTDPSAEANALIDALQSVDLSLRLPPAEMVIFEGAQGILLDEYFGFHPYTTWSTVTPKHAVEMLREAGSSDYQLLGITRAYSTRHGAGPFPSFCEELTSSISDKGNPHNHWQGAIKSGPLDLVLLRYAVSALEFAGFQLDGLVVNNLDDVSDVPRVCNSYRHESLGKIESLNIPLRMSDQESLTRLLSEVEPRVSKLTRAELKSHLGSLAPVVVESYGATHQHRRIEKSWAENACSSGPKFVDEPANVG